MHIELTDNAEAEALLGLLDIAVKAGGLNAAGPALHFAAKVQAALQATESKPIQSSLEQQP